VKKRSEHPQFIAGLTLAEGFYHDLVKPVLSEYYGGLPYSAALIGQGSEVLGFDSDMSTDHHWGPRVMLFLKPDDLKRYYEDIRKRLSRQLPWEYLGYPTNFSEPDPADHGVQKMHSGRSGTLNHRVEFFTLSDYFSAYLNIDISKPLEMSDWMALPFQKLRSIVSGGVFQDDLGLEKIRATLNWYPRDVWLYILASAWARIGQDEHLMGRAGYSGDELGSAVIGARLVRDIMRLCFLMERQYPPYAKWLGTAFAALESGKLLVPLLTEAMHARSWRRREVLLCQSYEKLAELHNRLELTEYIAPRTSKFFNRPFRRIDGFRFTLALMRKIEDTAVKNFSQRSPIGNIDLFSDNSDMLEDPLFLPVLKKLYE
jgi:hypothetical protein